MNAFQAQLLLGHSRRPLGELAYEDGWRYDFYPPHACARRPLTPRPTREGSREMAKRKPKRANGDTPPGLPTWCYSRGSSHTIKPRTDAEIVAGANELARKIYAGMGYRARKGYRFDRAAHPQELGCWNAAVMAYEHVDGTDVENALDNLDEDEAETPHAD